MMKCGVLFEVRPESLNIVRTRFGFKGLRKYFTVFHTFYNTASGFQNFTDSLSQVPIKSSMSYKLVSFSSTDMYRHKPRIIHVFWSGCLVASSDNIDPGVETQTRNINNNNNNTAAYITHVSFVAGFIINLPVVKARAVCTPALSWKRAGENWSLSEGRQIIFNYSSQKHTGALSKQIFERKCRTAHMCLR
jgi:hypothetical protein